MDSVFHELQSSAYKQDNVMSDKVCWGDELKVYNEKKVGDVNCCREPVRL